MTTRLAIVLAVLLACGKESPKAAALGDVWVLSRQRLAFQFSLLDESKKELAASGSGRWSFVDDGDGAKLCDGVFEFKAGDFERETVGRKRREVLLFSYGGIPIDECGGSNAERTVRFELHVEVDGKDLSTEHYLRY